MLPPQEFLKLGHALPRRFLISVALEFKSGMRFRKRWKLENLKVENSSVDYEWQRMTNANFKSLSITVWEFLGQTDIHMHFPFYITEDYT